MPVAGAEIKHVLVCEQACSYRRRRPLCPDLVAGGVQSKYRAIMRDEVNTLAVRYGRSSNFALGIGGCIAERPVRFARIHCQRNPFVVPRAKHNCAAELGKAGGRAAGAILPAQLAGPLFKGVNVTAFAAAV